MRLDSFIKSAFFPLLEHKGFAIGKVGFHRESGIWQIDCVFIVHARLYLSIQLGAWQVLTGPEAISCLAFIFPHLRYKVINIFKMRFIAELFNKFYFQSTTV